MHAVGQWPLKHTAVRSLLIKPTFFRRLFFLRSLHAALIQSLAEAGTMWLRGPRLAAMTAPSGSSALAASTSMEKIQQSIQVELKKTFQVDAAEGKLPERPPLFLFLCWCRVSLHPTSVLHTKSFQRSCCIPRP